MTSLPTVSVVVPCYNYGRFLDACVASVLSQDGVDARVLIIDDCSTDDSADVGRRLAQASTRVEFRRHERNQGHIATYNEGLLEWASGEFVTLLSADDELTAHSLRRSVEIMRAHPAVVMVYGGIEEFGDGAAAAASAGRETRAGVVVHSGAEWLRRRCRETVNVVPTPGTVLRTEVQRRIGGYDGALPHAGDFDMWLRAAAVGDVAYVRGAPQGRYRLHAASMSFGVYTEHLSDVRQRKMVFDSFFARHGEELRRQGIDPERTDRALASQPLAWAARAYERGEPTASEEDEAVEFAREVLGGIETLPAFRALRRRRRLGPRFCRGTQIFVGTALVRRVRHRLWWRRWRRSGG